jgi:hypothetical protein
MCSLFSLKRLFSKDIRPDYCTPQSGVLLTTSNAVTADRLKLLAANVVSRRSRGSMSAICALFVSEYVYSIRNAAVQILFHVALLIIKQHGGEN